MSASVSSWRSANQTDNEQAHRQVDNEDRPPSGDAEDHLPERRRHDGHQDEHAHDERHDARHRAALELVSHQRQRDRPRSGDTDALQEASDEHQRKGFGQQREHASSGEECEPDECRRLTADGVRQRAVHQLTEAEAEEQERQDQLIVVGALDTERGADGGERGQNHVDRQRHQRGERGHQRDEFNQADR